MHVHRPTSRLAAVLIAVTMLVIPIQSAAAAPVPSAAPASAQVAASVPAAAVSMAVPAGIGSYNLNTCRELNVVLSYGSQNPCVWVFQSWNDHSAYFYMHSLWLIPDSQFGYHTWLDVGLVQRNCHLRVDHVVGPLTWLCMSRQPTSVTLA